MSALSPLQKQIYVQAKQLNLPTWDDVPYGCCLCENGTGKPYETGPHEGIWTPGYYGWYAHRSCTEVVQAAEKTFLEAVQTTFPTQTSRSEGNNAERAARTAVRIECGMPITEYLKKNGEAALEGIYNSRGIEVIQGNVNNS